MQSNAWDDLPNAKHIDWVLADVKRNPQKWAEARGALRGPAWAKALVTCFEVARLAIRNDAQVAVRVAIYYAPIVEAYKDAAWAAARGVCAALVAWDYAGDVLSMEPDAVHLLASAGDHAAVLMLPAVIVKHSKE